MPDFSNMFQQGPKYRALDSDIASMAAPGPVSAGGPGQLLCRVGRGSARFDKKWLEFPDADFALSPQSRINVPLHPKKGSGTMSFQAMFDRDGQRLVFCPLVDGPPDERVSCASVYALDDDLQAGIKRTFDIPDGIAGASITCAYDKSHLQKL